MRFHLIFALAFLAPAAPLPPRPSAPMPKVTSEDGDIDLDDLSRFPDRETVEAVQEWQEQHVAWIKAQIQLDLVNVAFWRQWFEDADKRRVQWRWLLRAHERRHSDPVGSLCCLKNLEERIGRDAYLYGRMPCPFPALHRFAPIP